MENGWKNELEDVDVVRGRILFCPPTEPEGLNRCTDIGEEETSEKGEL